MKVYKVGGAVRDELLGLPVKDRDHVVVGATPEEMERLGYRPVGKDFPVFLHPETQEEYALARTERKTARGYKGFTVYAAPDVTLEDDLARRDLTINAIAKDESTGALIDPFDGASDLKAGVLRHVGPSFPEDPVRILRVARFAARFGFRIAPETLELMRQMVEEGETDHLVAERVWQEFAKGLMEHAPRRMFDSLEACGALVHVLPEWRRVDGSRALAALDRAAVLGHPLPVRYAVLFAGGPAEAADEASARLRAPTDCRDLALLAARWSARVREARRLDAAALVDLLERTDAFRRPERFASLVDACECDAAAIAADPARRPVLERALAAARGVDAGAIAAANPGDVPGAIHAARVGAVAAAAAAA
jgi:tRNA nucleotidyltransferase (CCA-adding enzyme)